MVRWALISPSAVGRVQVAAGQVEGVAGAQHRVDDRLALGGGGDLRGAGRSTAGCAAGRRSTGSWIVQCFSPATCSTKTSCTS